jgi:multicomponent Na+:H+ antiporter subunit E
VLNYTNFFFGFALGFFILWILSRTTKQSERGYFYRVPKVIFFIFYFFYDMIKANIEVTKEILSPGLSITPGIIAYEHSLKTDFEMTMLTTLIALTPGTMVIKISDDKKIIYIHGLYMIDKEKFIHKMKTGLEKKMIEILR